MSARQTWIAVVLGGAAAALLYTSCAKPLDQLGPFPCPQDGCPDGYECRGNKCVVPPPIDAPPDATCRPAGNCQVVPQTLCTCPNTACDIDRQTHFFSCRDATSDGVETKVCNSPSDCAKGYTCSSTLAGSSCLKYCATNTDCQDRGSGDCAVDIKGSDGSPFGSVTACSSACDPTQATNASCPVGWACALAALTHNAAPFDELICSEPGVLTQGQQCVGSGDCAAGFTCAPVGSATKCAQVCVVGGATVCPTATTCHSFTRPFIVRTVNYGYCL